MQIQKAAIYFLLIVFITFQVKSEKSHIYDEKFFDEYFKIIGADIEILAKSMEWGNLYEEGFIQYKRDFILDSKASLSKKASAYGNMRRMHLALKMIVGIQTEFDKDETWAVLFPPPSFVDPIKLDVNLEKYRSTSAMAWFNRVSSILASNDSKYNRMFYDILSAGKIFLASSEYEGLYDKINVSSLNDIFRSCGLLVSQKPVQESIFYGASEKLAHNEWQVEEWESFPISEDQLLQGISLFRDLARTRYFKTIETRNDFAKSEVRNAEGEAFALLAKLQNMLDVIDDSQLNQLLLFLEKPSNSINIKEEKINESEFSLENERLAAWWTDVVISLGIVNMETQVTADSIVNLLNKVESCISINDKIAKINPSSDAVESNNRIKTKMKTLWKHGFEKMKYKSLQ